MSKHKFKVGQKVRVKEWLDMPEDMRLQWGRACIWFPVGTKLIIEAHRGREGGEIVYYTEISDEIDGLMGSKQLMFEKELEPVVKVGEQLMLFEL